MPVFYRRVYGLEPYEISIYLCIVLTIGGLSGSYVGGYTADFWYKVCNFLKEYFFCFYFN